jgi:ABC-type dipeptide/oligopeptide/nickel transport system permease component
MLSYLLRRAALSVVVLFGIAVVTFLAVHLVPGDPARIALGAHATPESVAHLRHQMGLDASLGHQFIEFLGNTVTGNLGTSFIYNSSVSELIGNRIGATATLMAYGLLVAVLIGVPMAILAALRPGGLRDNLIRLVTTFSFAMPPFWFGLMLALLLGLKLSLFPVSGYETGLSGTLRTMTLPALTLALALLVFIVRNLRSSLLTSLQSEYVEAARGRGFRESRIVSRHAMRNSVIGTITIVASLFGYVIGVMVLIEAVFQIPGAGSLLVQAVNKRDYQLVQGLTLLAGAVVVFVGLFTDLLHAALDPRVRLAGGHE